MNSSLSWIRFRVAYWESLESLTRFFLTKLNSKVKEMGEPSKLELLEARLLKMEENANRLTEIADGALTLLGEMNNRTKDVANKWDITEKTLSVNDVKGRIMLLRRELNKCRGSSGT